MSKNIAKGAEANLSKGKWDGLDCVFKERVKKNYRLKELDESLRKKRTKGEAKLLSDARRAGVPTPQVYNRERYVLTMEFIEGEKLRDVFKKSSKDRIKRISKNVGENIAKLHNRNIVHGDLTTSNMILNDGKVYFIDFGLGYHTHSVEDKAVDLYLLLEILKSTHHKNKDLIWNGIMDGYDSYKQSERIIEKIEDIKTRGRYVSG